MVKNLPANAGDIRDMVSILGSQRSFEGYSPWGCEESDTIERLSMHSKGYRSAAMG